MSKEYLSAIDRNKSILETSSYIELVAAISGDAKFDFIIFTGLSEVPDLFQFFDTIKDSLNAGGKLCLTIPNKCCTADRYRQSVSFAEIYDIHKRGIENNPKNILDSLLTSENFNKAIEIYDLVKMSKDGYVQMNYNVFTPESFLVLIYQFLKTNLLPFKVMFFAAPENENEFDIVLEKDENTLLGENSDAEAQHVLEALNALNKENENYSLNLANSNEQAQEAQKLIAYSNRLSNIMNHERKYAAISKEILKYFGNQILQNALNKEQMEIAAFLFNNELSVFPYQWTKKYNPQTIDVYNDGDFKFVLHKGQRLYFCKEWNVEQIKDYYNSLIMEQDEQSPHRYSTDKFMVRSGDVIADIGAAEGIWALESAAKARKIYLFECDPKWMETLKKTFDPWQDKTQIINKYVSNKSEGDNVTLDVFFKEEKIDFIKADIEGAEVAMLQGAAKTMQANKNLKMLLCAYHKHNDAKELKECLENNGFRTEFSNGYMLFLHGFMHNYEAEFKPPYLRRGLIRAEK